MAKQGSYKGRDIYILKTFLEKSDKENPVSTQDLIDMLAAHDIGASRKSIYSSIDVLRECGFSIEKTLRGWYLTERDFELEDLRILTDNVKAARYLDSSNTRKISDKLIVQAGAGDRKRLRKQMSEGAANKTLNDETMDNIHRIYVAIETDSKLRFRYCHWTVDKELVTDDDETVISPYSTGIENERYFVKGSDGQGMKTYYIDRMKDVMYSSEPRERTDMQENVEKITLECDDEILDDMMDRFGPDPFIYRIGEGRFSIVIGSDLSDSFYGYIAGFGGRARITQPQKAADGLRAVLAKVMDAQGGKI